MKEKKGGQFTKDWKWMKLGEAVKVLDNLRKPINSTEREARIAGKKVSELFPYYGATGQVGWIDSFITNGEYVLVGEDGAPFLDFYKTKSYKITGKTWVNNHAHILQELEGMTTNSFILHYLNAIDYRPYVNGTTRLKLTKGNLVDIPFPVPSLSIQQAIVSKIEELFSELDKGIEQLKIAQQQLKTYRQSVLKWAFEGRLTNENVKEGKLPEGWTREFLGSVSDMCLGKMLDKQKNKGTFRPYLRNINVRWGVFDLENLMQMRFEDSELERYSLRRDDLVICEGGEPGRCSIWNFDDNPMMIQKALHRVRVKSSVNIKYLYYFIFFSGLTGNLEKYFTGTTIKHLTGKELKKIQFPLPSSEMQRHIVQEIERRLSLSDKMEESIRRSLEQSEVLRQSILKKAFEGTLL